jgi:hypothetical protein
VAMIMVNHPSRVTEKERNGVCTRDEHRKVIMEKVGKIHGDVWSVVRNSHSRHVYLILTPPELGADYWVTHIFLMVQKRAWFGLITFTMTDFNHPIIALIRNNKEDAYQLHAQIRYIVTHEKEEGWFAFLPSSKPPEGAPRRHSTDEESL